MAGTNVLHLTVKKSYPVEDIWEKEPILDPSPLPTFGTTFPIYTHTPIGDLGLNLSLIWMKLVFMCCRN